MKKIISLLLAVCLCGAALAGCGETETPSVNGTVATDGSTSMEKVIGYFKEAYTEKNPEVNVTYNPTGSGSGIQAVLEGRCDIGLSSRDLKAEEAEKLAEHYYFNGKVQWESTRLDCDTEPYEGSGLEE